MDKLIKILEANYPRENWSCFTHMRLVGNQAAHMAGDMHVSVEQMRDMLHQFNQALEIARSVLEKTRIQQQQQQQQQTMQQFFNNSSGQTTTFGVNKSSISTPITSTQLNAEAPEFHPTTKQNMYDH